MRQKYEKRKPGKLFPLFSFIAFFLIFAACFYLIHDPSQYSILFMKKILILIGVMAILVSCSDSGNKQAKLDKLKKEHDRIAAEISTLENEINPGGASSQSVMVMVDTVMPTHFEHFIEVQGRIDGTENVAVSPRSPGVVTRILVDEGDYVKKGQILAELDAEVLKQQLADLKTQLAFATDLYMKQKDLWDQKIGSELQYLTAKNNMESLQNKMAILEDQISMSHITAPIDGTVEEIPIKVGQLAAVGSPTPAFRIVNFSKAKAVADIGEANTAKVKTGDQVRVFLPDLNKELTERVTFASRFINPVNRTFQVEVTLPPDQDVYRANMIAVLKIKDYSKPETIAVPQDYVQASGDEGLYVFVATTRDGKRVAHKQRVETGITYDGLTEILSGLKAGDILITAGYKDLYEGQFIDYK
jgi:membrane fusion protein, multidrug efflux system